MPGKPADLRYLPDGRPALEILETGRRTARRPRRHELHGALIGREDVIWGCPQSITELRDGPRIRLRRACSGSDVEGERVAKPGPDGLHATVRARDSPPATAAAPEDEVTLGGVEDLLQLLQISGQSSEPRGILDGGPQVGAGALDMPEIAPSELVSSAREPEESVAKVIDAPQYSAPVPYRFSSRSRGSAFFRGQRGNW